MPDKKLLCPYSLYHFMKHFKIQCGFMKINIESDLSSYVKRQLKLPDAALVHSYH